MSQSQSQRPRPHERWGQESFRRRSVICDINESVTDAATSTDATGLSVDEISASGTKATPPSSSRTEALKRLRLAASTIILTNDLKIEHNDEAGKRLNRAANTIIMTNNLLLLQRSKASLTSKESSIEEETPAPPITSHPRNAGQYTVVAFVNSASGGGMGNVIFKSLQDLLGPSFVIDLHTCRPGNMPEDSLLKYAYDPMVRVLACGGDGTCGWILSCLDKVWSIVLESEQLSSQRHTNLLKYKDHLPLAIMPLGTGNDLSRQFGWGGTFQPHMKKKSMIASVQRSKLTSLDIWRCIIMPVEKLAEEEKQLIPEILGEIYKDSERESSMNSVKLLHSLLEPDESSEVSKRGMKLKENSTTSVSSNDVYDGVLCNYFSLGFDATVAYRFHQEREAHPEKFTSPLKNKMVYVMNTPAALTSPRLKHRVKVLVNNENGELVHLKVPRSCRAIVLMNIQSYGGGNRLSSEGSPADGLIEVIFVSNIVRAASVCALSPVMPFVRFNVAAKTNNVYIRTKCPLHCQVDGEPWLQDEGVIQVKFHSRKSILEKESIQAMCGCMSSTDDSVVT